MLKEITVDAEDETFSFGEKGLHCKNDHPITLIHLSK